MSPAPRPDSPLTLRLASALGVVAALSLSVAGCRDKRRDPDEPTRASGASGAGSAASTAGPASTSSPSSTSSTSSSTSGPGGPPTAAAQATSAATLTLDGKPVALELALVKRRPDGSLQLYAGQRGATCAMLQDNLFTGGASKVLVDLPTRLAPDGTEALAVGDLHHGGPQTPDPGARAKLVGALGAKGERVTLELAAASRSAGVSLEGTVVAESCGDELRTSGPGMPSPALATSAMLTVAGKKLALRGALVRGESFELTDFPRDCSSAWFLGARLEAKGSSLSLDGKRFAEAIKADAKGLSIQKSPKPPRKHEGLDVVELSLSGTTRLGAYELSLSGTMEALVCPP